MGILATVLVAWGLLFLAYLELHPALGGIWIRPDAEGIPRVAWRSLAAFLWAPFTPQGAHLWQPAFWDIHGILQGSVLILMYVVGDAFG